MLNYARGKFSKLDALNGFVFQNFIFILLRAKYQTPISPVNHWRTKDKAEVDFVIHKPSTTIPVEVKFSHLKKKSISRSFRSYINRYKPEKAIVVNLSLDEQLVLNGTEIEFIPFWKLA